MIATSPLTDDEIWTRFTPGDLALFQHGALLKTVNVPVPADVAEKAREPLCKVCVESVLRAETIETTADVETELGIE